MKVKNNTILCVFALTTLAATFGSCRSEDDVLNGLPHGSVPLQVGEVSVAGMKTNTRSSAGGSTSTRGMSVTENAKGYTGIRKSNFVDGDELALVLSNDGGTTTTTVAATLTAGAWTLSEKAYVIPGTTIKATHAAVATTAGFNADDLEATTYTLTGQKVAFAMKHTNAMIDITIPAGVTVTNITAAAHNGTADETLNTIAEDEADGTKHYRTIALPGTTSNPGTVKSITAVINGMNYVTTLATPLTVEANKKYPIALTFKDNKLTASVGAAALDWGMGGTTDVGLPAGYTRVIDSPEALAQFAKDVNDDSNTGGVGACLSTAIQIADIDLSRLKPASEAGINPRTGTPYTYTATADAWVPIVSNTMSSYAFKGTYNGNGHTISNMKIVVNAGDGMDRAALFGLVEDATLTGIHLRDVSIICHSTDVLLSAGALAGWLNGGTTVSLCSATGTIQVEEACEVGGMFGVMELGNSVTHCNARVNISVNSSSGYDPLYIGGFTGKTEGDVIAGCSSFGTITWGATDNFYAGGFTGGILGDNATTRVTNCYCGGNMQGTAGFGFVSLLYPYVTEATISNCYSGIAGAGDFTASTFYSDALHHFTDCAYTAADASTITGITGSVPVADLYATVTAGNAVLADVKTLHWSKADGYTTNVVNAAWLAKGVWKNNGTAAPTLDLSYEGTTEDFEGTPAVLLAVPGKAGWWMEPMRSINEPWVDPSTVCPTGWKIPSKSEWEEIACIPASGTLDWNVYPSEVVRNVLGYSHKMYYSSTMDVKSVWVLMIGSGSDISMQKSDLQSSFDFEYRCVKKVE